MGRPQDERQAPEQAAQGQDENKAKAPIRIACVAANTDIRIAIKAKGPIDNHEFDRLVMQQVNHRFAPDGLVDNEDDPRTSCCFLFSQEAIVALAHYYGINGSVIVKLKRPDFCHPFDPEAKEEHHIVLLSDDRVVDLTAEQFWRGGVGPIARGTLKGSEEDILPRIYFRPWKEAIQSYRDIGLAFCSILSEEAFLAADAFDFNPGVKARSNGACPTLPAPPRGAYGTRKHVPYHPPTITLPPIPPRDEAGRLPAATAEMGKVELYLTIEDDGSVSDVSIADLTPQRQSDGSGGYLEATEVAQGECLKYADDLKYALKRSVYSPATIDGWSVRSLTKRSFDASNPAGR